MSRIPVCCQGMARTYLIASKMCRNIVKGPIFYTTIVGTISFATGVSPLWLASGEGRLVPPQACHRSGWHRVRDVSFPHRRVTALAGIG